MAKRKLERKSNDSNEIESSPQKRPRDEVSSPLKSRQSVTYGRVDPTYGQRSAIPGLDDQDAEDGDSEVEYGVDVDALSYLRSVRIEASGIPTLLVAPRTGRGEGEGAGAEGEGGLDRGIYEDGVGDMRGWYEDGAYTAAPAEVNGISAGDDGAGGVRGAQEVYYESLLARFSALRRKLAQVPPRHAVERLDADHSSYMSGSAKDYKLWRWRLQHTDPVTAQLAGMDKGTVLNLLRMAGDTKGKYLNLCEGQKERRRMSLWVWGLLARLPERGELVSEEVGIVRELGKRAVWIGVEMKGVDMVGLRDQIGHGEEGGDESGDEEVVEVEVDGDDDELDLPGGAAEDEDFTNGDDMDGQDLGNSHWDPLDSSFLSESGAVPIIGPTLPEPFQEPTPQQPSPNNSLARHEIIKGDAREREEAEEAALEAARVRLIARIQSNVLPPSKPSPEQLEDGEWNGDDDDKTGDTENNEEKYHKEEDPKEEKEEGSPQSAIQATKALLDMIITIAGEVYGQRDLIEFREVWD